MNRLNKHSRPSEKTFWVCITNWSAVVSYCIEQGNEFKCFGFLHHNSFHWILVIQIQENSSHTCIPNQLSVQNLNNLFMVLLLSVFTMGSGAHCSMVIGVRPVTQRFQPRCGQLILCIIPIDKECYLHCTRLPSWNESDQAWWYYVMDWCPCGLRKNCRLT